MALPKDSPSEQQPSEQSDKKFDWDEIQAELERATMGVEEFRDTALSLIWKDDEQGLEQLCTSQMITAPLFVEKVIAEIRPGNEWNDLLFLLGRRLIRAGRWHYLSPSLEEKRCHVQNPEGGREILASLIATPETSPTFRVEDGRTIPESLRKLFEGDLTGLDPKDESTLDRVFADWLVVGPGFYHRYLASKSFEYGDRMISEIPMGTPPKAKLFEGRVFRGVARAVPLVVDEFQDILAKYRNGKLRDATDDERELFYALINFEIEGRPVPVIEAEEGRLVVYLQEGDRIYWIDSLDAWHQEAASQPPASLGNATLDALKKRFE
jgi:hypothetical protein